MRATRRTSRVARWLDLRSFGFLKNPDGEGLDIFVHARQVPVRKGHGQLLLEDELVEFEIIQTPKGLEAVHVTFPMQGNQKFALPQRDHRTYG